MKLTLQFPIKRLKTLDDLQQFVPTLQELMLLHTKIQDISSALMCDEVLLEEWANLNYEVPFEDVCQSFKSRASANLISKQFSKALEDGSEKLLVHLGKNYANQVDDATKLSVVNAENVVFKEGEILQDIGNYKEDI